MQSKPLISDTVLRVLLVLALIALAAAPVAAQTRVGVSVEVNQPGVYGRIDIGDVAPPPVVYPQPVVIAPTPVTVHRQPIYLYVPPGHQKRWDRYCSRYAACGQPVYFVQERWVVERYERDHEGRGRGRDKKSKHGKGHGRGHD